MLGSSSLLFDIESIATPIPITKNTKYGVSFPNNCDMTPAIIGPLAHPIPNTVSYAPIMVPEISFLVLLKTISNVNGKKILNPNPNNVIAIANSTMLSTKNERPNPAAIEKVARINVRLVFFANLLAIMRVIILDKPKIKNKKISNLYYTGQLTVPGPGMPPALVSGKVVADQVMSDIK